MWTIGSLFTLELCKNDFNYFYIGLNEEASLKSVVI